MKKATEQKEPVKYRTQMLCVGADLQLSPKLEDRVKRYRFIPVPGSAPLGVKGDLFHESAVAIYGEAGAYQIGQPYGFTTTTEE